MANFEPLAIGDRFRLIKAAMQALASLRSLFGDIDFGDLGTIAKLMMAVVNAPTTREKIEAALDLFQAIAQQTENEWDNSVADAIEAVIEGGVLDVVIRQAELAAEGSVAALSTEDTQQINAASLNVTAILSLIQLIVDLIAGLRGR